MSAVAGALPLEEWAIGVREALEGGDFLVRSAAVDASYTTNCTIVDDAVLSATADLLEEAQEGMPEGVVILSDVPGQLQLLQKCRRRIEGHWQLLLVHPNPYDAAKSMHTATLHPSQLGRVRLYHGSLEEACEAAVRSRVPVAAVHVRRGHGPERTGQEACRVLGTRALRRGAVLMLHPSVSALSEEKGTKAAHAAVAAMTRAVAAAAKEEGYKLQLDEEAGDGICNTARVFRVAAAPAQRARGHAEQGDAAREAALYGFLYGCPDVLLDPAHKLCFVKDVDNSRLKLHLRSGCSGADECHRRSSVSGSELCSTCVAAVEAGEPASLRRMLAGKAAHMKVTAAAPPPACKSEAGGGGKAAAAPAPAPARKSEAGKGGKAPAPSKAAAQPAPRPKLAKQIMVFVAPTGKKLHWHASCQYVRKGQWAPVALTPAMLEQYTAKCSACQKISDAMA